MTSVMPQVDLVMSGFIEKEKKINNRDMTEEFVNRL